ncbi:MucR family transcriptional regulator, partial [Sphingopyxis sp. SCN 67-31]
MNDIPQDTGDLLTLTADIVAAHVGNNSVAISDLSLLINNVHSALSALSHPAEKPEEPLVP